jgi:hypothetical protein
MGARLVVALGLCAALLSGCASTPQGIALGPGTLTLGEAQHVLTRAMVDAGEFAPGDTRAGLAEQLRSAGFTDAQIDAGQVFVVRRQIYWHNTASGIKHSELAPALVPPTLTVEPGNVVEIEIAQRPPWSVVQRVRAVSLADGGCYYGDVPVGAAVEAMGAMSLVGPRGSASLYCAGIENEGWQRPRTYWHKLPGATAAPAAAPAPAPVPISPEGGAPPPPSPAEVASDGMATLVLYLKPRRPALPFFFALPLSIDGDKVAELDHGTCEVVRVPAGDHVVVAGTGDKGVLRTHARRELAISVRAGERVVLEYSVDDQALLESERFFVSRDKWESRIYHFTQRPATAQDACAIRYMPTTLGR